MSKKHFIALADTIKRFNHDYPEYAFGHVQLEVLAAFCKVQNASFMQQRWLDYIADKCGPNGGKVRVA